MQVDDYDPYADDVGSWRDAIEALAERHRAAVKSGASGAVVTAVRGKGKGGIHQSFDGGNGAGPAK